MIAELLICGAALGADGSDWTKPLPVPRPIEVLGYAGKDRMWVDPSSTGKFDPGWGECGYLLPFTLTVTGAHPRSCTERAWPVGVEEFSVQRTRKIKSGDTIIWSEFSRHIKLVCPSLHVTYRKVKGEQKR